MSRRDEGDEFEEQSDRRDRQEDGPPRRQFSGMTKIFDPVTKKVTIVEYSPDTTDEFNELAQLVFQQQGSPTLDRCIQLCMNVGVRARVLQYGQYLGHIWPDGSVDAGVSRLVK